MLDKDSRPAPDLTRDQFEIYEEGKPQKIEVFEPETQQPLDLALMVDSSLSEMKELEFETEAAARFIAQSRAARRSRGGVRIFRCGHPARGLFRRRAAPADGGAAIAPGDGTALYDAVYLGSQALERGGAGRRRALVLLTDAGETTSRADFETARRAAVRAEALLYTIVIRPVKNESGRNTAGEHALETIADTTGGAMYYPDELSQLDAMFDRIDRELRTQYRLGLLSPAPPAAGRVPADRSPRERRLQGALSQVLLFRRSRGMRTGRRNHSMMNSYLEVAVEAAREGGRILLAEFDRPAKISYKGEVDIVTQADRRSEQAIVTRLRTHFPKHAIVAEEGGGQRNRLALPLASSIRWTAPRILLTAIHVFAVSIGLEEAGELIVGVDLSAGHAGALHRGQGRRRLSEPEAHPRVRHRSPGDQPAVHRLPQRQALPQPEYSLLLGFHLRSHGVRRDGSAALDLAAVACGRFDGFWEFGLHPWDTAAGVCWCARRAAR